MKTAIALTHVAFEGPGLLAGLLEESGYALQIRDVPTEGVGDAAEDCDLLIVLGGPIGVYETEAYPFLQDEISLLQRRLAAEKPVLGICLGAQLIARALGQPVYASGVKEIGWAPLLLSDDPDETLLAPLAGTPVLHWHGDTFDLPEGARLLASTPLICNQAYVIGAHVLGLQFHLEAQVPELERWYVGHACEIAGTPGIDVALLRRQALDYGPGLIGPAQMVFRTWLAGLDGTPQR